MSYGEASTNNDINARELTPAGRLELAGSLQAIIADVKNRDFSLDIEQEEALEAIGHALLDGHSNGYIEMPTSTGKTLIESLVAEAAVRSGRRVLMLAPTKSVAAQLHGHNQQKSTGLGRFTQLNQTADIHPHFGSTLGTNRDADVVVSTYSGFLNEYKNGGVKLGRFDVVIADECQRSLGEATSEALKAAYPAAIKIGFSATPDYAIDRKSEEVYERSLFEFSLLSAVESGRTAPVRALIYTTDDTLHLADGRNEFTERELAPLIESLQRNGTALELAKAFVAEGRQGIIACIPGDKNYHARLLAKICTQGGIRAADVGAHLTDQEVSNRLKQFQNGELDILTFTRSLEEGWDSDKASFAMNLAPTTSPVRTKQLLGRVLRKKPDGLESIYVDFLDDTVGVIKQQYTAMHALGMEHIDFNRVLGKGAGESDQWSYIDIKGLKSISPHLFKKLSALQGRLLTDITVRPHEDPLVRQWNQRLSKEGIPDELAHNDILPPSLIRRIEEANRRFHDEHGHDPSTIDELREYIGGVESSRRQAMGYYGLLLPIDSLDVPEPVHDPFEDSTHETVGTSMMTGQIEAVLSTLLPRENTVIRARFGFDDKPSTFDEIGEIIGLSRERVRQIESKSLVKLRRLGRRGIHPYADLVRFNPEHPANIDQLLDAYSLNSLVHFIRKAQFISVKEIEQLSDEDIIRMFLAPIKRPNFKLGGYEYVHLGKQIAPRVRTMTHRANANQAPKMPVQKIWAGVQRLDKVASKKEGIIVSLFS